MDGPPTLSSVRRGAAAALSTLPWVSVFELRWSASTGEQAGQIGIGGEQGSGLQRQFTGEGGDLLSAGVLALSYGDAATQQGQTSSVEMPATKR